jgi:hypothetical protein
MNNNTIPPYTVIQYIRRKRKNESLIKSAISKLTIEEQKALGVYNMRNRTPYGVMVAVKNSDGTFNTGYSICNRKDQFNKKRALKIAIDRAAAYEHPGFFHHDNEGNNFMPHDLEKHFASFVNRCKKYYKINSSLDGQS